MRLPLAPGDLVQVAARAVIPVAGILFLQWQPGDVVFVYCADVLASVYVVCVLTCARLFAMEPVEGPAWWRRLWVGVQLGLTAIAPWLAIALPLAATMAIVLATVGLDWQHVLASRSLWLAAAAQFGTAVLFLLREYDAIVDAPNADWAIKRQFGLVFLRWVIVLMIGWSVLAGLPGYGFTVVLACSVATIAVELFPNRVLRSVGAADLAMLPDARDPASPGGMPPTARVARHASRHGRRRH